MYVCLDKSQYRGEILKFLSKKNHSKPLLWCLVIERAIKFLLFGVVVCHT